VYDRAIAHTHLDRTLATDFELYLQDDLLVKADRMAMAHSLETRAPFLDTDVLALSLRMPEGLRIRGGVQKYALRQAFRDVLPSENVNRIKRGFGMPIGSWLRGHLHALTHEVLTDPSLYARGWFVRAYVEQLLDEHQGGREDHGQRLWALLVLALWLRQFESGLPGGRGKLPLLFTCYLFGWLRDIRSGRARDHQNQALFGINPRARSNCHSLACGLPCATERCPCIRYRRSLARCSRGS
jgi:hypothetical protein